MGIGEENEKGFAITAKKEDTGVSGYASGIRGRRKWSILKVGREMSSVYGEGRGEKGGGKRFGLSTIGRGRGKSTP